jgi:hypothetical protein
MNNNYIRDGYLCEDKWRKDYEHMSEIRTEYFEWAYMVTIKYKVNINTGLLEEVKECSHWEDIIWPCCSHGKVDSIMD